MRATLAVKHHGSGVTSAELAGFIDLMSMFAADRVEGVGNDQYSSSSGQRFEAMSEEELRHELVEELLDVINYVCMIAIKVVDL